MNKEYYSSEMSYKTYLDDNLDKCIYALARDHNMTLEELKNILGKNYYEFCFDVFYEVCDTGCTTSEAFIKNLQFYNVNLDESFMEKLIIRLEDIKKENVLISRGKLVR